MLPSPPVAGEAGSGGAPAYARRAAPGLGSAPRRSWHGSEGLDGERGGAGRLGRRARRTGRARAPRDGGARRRPRGPPACWPRSWPRCSGGGAVEDPSRRGRRRADASVPVPGRGAGRAAGSGWVVGPGRRGPATGPRAGCRWPSSTRFAAAEDQPRRPGRRTCGRTAPASSTSAPAPAGWPSRSRGAIRARASSASTSSIAALALARANVAAEGLGRPGRAAPPGRHGVGGRRESTTPCGCPLPFLPRAVVEPALAACARALRPGGWLLAGTFAGPPGRLAELLVDLRTVRAGGHPWRDEELLCRPGRRGLRRRRGGPLGSGPRPSACSSDSAARKPGAASTGPHWRPWTRRCWPGASRTPAPCSAPAGTCSAPRTRTRPPSTASSPTSAPPASTARPSPSGSTPTGASGWSSSRAPCPCRPTHDWAQTDAALASIAALMRRLHEAARAFDVAGASLEHRDGRPGPRLGRRPDGGGRPRRLPQRRLPRERGLPRRRGRRAPRLRLRGAGPSRLRPGADGPDVRAGGRPARRRPLRLAAGRHRPGAGPVGG